MVSKLVVLLGCLVNLVRRFGSKEKNGIRRKDEGGNIQKARFSIIENANGILPLPKGPLQTS